MMKVCPGIFYAWKSHGLEEAADDHIHFWYDSINDVAIKTRCRLK